MKHATLVGSALAGMAICILLIELWAYNQPESAIMAATGNILLQPGGPASLATFSIAKSIVSLASILMLVAGLVIIARSKER